MVYVIGIVAGLVSGFFGAGGGLILVPAFIRILKIDDYIARGTAITSVLPMVIVSGIFYYQKNYFDMDLFPYIVAGGIIGGVIGARIMKKISKFYLNLIFDIFLIFVAIKIIIK